MCGFQLQRKSLTDFCLTKENFKEKFIPHCSFTRTTVSLWQSWFIIVFSKQRHLFTNGNVLNFTLFITACKTISYFALAHDSSVYNREFIIFSSILNAIFAARNEDRSASQELLRNYQQMRTIRIKQVTALLIRFFIPIF